MHNKLKTLFELQKRDTRLAQIERSKEGLPQLVNEIQAEIDAESANLLSFQDSINKLNAHLLENSRQNDESQKFLEHSRDRRSQVTNNKEYEALINEIAFHEKQQSDCSGKKDLLVQEIAKNREAAEKAEENIKALSGRLETSRQQLEAKLAETVIEENELREQKKTLQSQLPLQLNRLYERIYAAKNGLAVAKADDGSCSGCHTRLPSQKISELKRYDSLVHCDVCSRILTLGMDK